VTGTTGVRDLQVTCIIGIHPHERVQEQSVFLDIEIDYDFGPAAASDALGDVVDYDMVVAAVTDMVRGRQFHLIETLAESAAALLFDRVAQATAVRLEVRKPAAVPRARHSFVRVERARA